MELNYDRKEEMKKKLYARIGQRASHVVSFCCQLDESKKYNSLVWKLKFNLIRSRCGGARTVTMIGGLDRVPHKIPCESNKTKNIYPSNDFQLNFSI